MQETINKLEIQTWKVSNAYAARYVNNTKRHDLPAIMCSIASYGFKNAPHYDGTLKAIDDGNGRIEALHLMETVLYDEPIQRYKEFFEKVGDKYKWLRPRGIETDAAGNWTLPVVVGVDAQSIDEAIRYVYDANLTNLTGSATYKIQEFNGLTIEDILAMNVAPVAFSEQDLAFFESLSAFDHTIGEGDEEKDDPEKEDKRSPKIVITLYDPDEEGVETIEEIREMILSYIQAEDLANIVKLSAV